MIEKRHALSPLEADEKSRKIEAVLMAQPEFSEAEKIFIYYGVRNEVNTSGIIEKSLSLGKTVGLPITRKGREMDFFRLDSLSSLKKGPMHIPQPPADAEKLLPDEKTFVIAPGTVFDRHKNRIGMGKGFYDIYFSKYRDVDFKTAGLCYDFQIVDELPCEEHDVPLNKIISEKGVIE